MQQTQHFLTENKSVRATDSEKALLTTQVIKLRLDGLNFEEIGQQLSISKSQSCRYFADAMKESKQEWISQKDELLLEFNRRFRNRLKEAEENYLKSKEAGENGASYSWHRSIIETLKAYHEFLTSIGFLTNDDLKKENKNSDDPILRLVAANREKLENELTRQKAPHETEKGPIQEG